MNVSLVVCDGSHPSQLSPQTKSHWDNVLCWGTWPILGYPFPEGSELFKNSEAMVNLLAWLCHNIVSSPLSLWDSCNAWTTSLPNGSPVFLEAMTQRNQCWHQDHSPPPPFHVSMYSMCPPGRGSVVQASLHPRGASSLAAHFFLKTGGTNIALAKHRTLAFWAMNLTRHSLSECILLW